MNVGGTFQTDTENEFTAAIDRLTHRRVVAFLSANQTTPDVACELFFLEAAPLSGRPRPAYERPRGGR